MEKWSARDVVAVGYIALCFFFAWFMSLINLIIDKHFPDRAYAQTVVATDVSPMGDTFLSQEEVSYWGPRWMFFGPHVFSAIVWWNFSWIQLIKSIRSKALWLHRWNGRIQVIAMIGQIITGTGLALHAPTPGIEMVSIAYAFAMTYVLAQTVYHVLQKDIVRHKYWATKLFGYAQVIALQRVFLFSFFALTLLGSSLYTPPDLLSSVEAKNAQTKQMFNDSFTMAIFCGIAFTEWYQAADHNALLEYRKKEADAVKEGLTKPLMA
mmetsp:Transcript_26804/g.50431  ORF Transcript_26804/g.50431 Transcript_26804/m.50431 type:complete len:266 (+) Transcript_26804:72-869(+)